MALRVRRSRFSADRRAARERIVMVVLPLAALALLVMPQSASDRVRIWAGPVFSPLEDLTQGWALDLADRIRNPSGAPQADEASLRRQVVTLENAVAEATGLLAQFDRRVREMGRIRQELNGLPCRLIPARLIAPEMAGGPAAARLGEGSEKGIKRGSAVISRRIDRGAREALQRGEPILTAAGLVGLVEQVGPMTSTVRLVTDPQTNIRVQIIMRRGDQWRAGPEGAATGTPDGSAVRVLYVDRRSDVQPGDFLVTSPAPDSPLPPYLIVGQVVRCDLKPASLTYDLVAKPRVDLGDIREVYVLTPDTDAPAK